MKLAIIIPAYNEEKSITKVIESLPKKISGIDSIVPIVVDDGSIDKTYKVAKRGNKVTLSHVVNLGVGAATKTGLEAAKSLGADVCVTMDADGQHNPSDITNLIKPILRNDADVVIGTRMLNTKGMPWLKIAGNWFMNFITFIVYQKWVSDSQSGMKAFSKKALKKIDLKSIGYEICSEIVGECHIKKLKVAEVPIETIYSDYSKAKGQSWLNGINILTKIIHFRIGSRK